MNEDELIDAIWSYQKSHARCPSLNDIARALGVGKGTVKHHKERTLHVKVVGYDSRGRPYRLVWKENDEQSTRVGGHRD